MIGIDEDSKVIFEPKGHKYYNERNDQYTSVTTLIGKYKNPFDEEYWATYKSIKIVLGNRNMFDIFKKEAGGWENVVAYWSANPILLDEVLDKILEFKKKWEQERKAACDRGTREHLKREEMMKSCKLIRGTSKHTRNIYLPVSSNSIMSYSNENAAYAEALVWNHQYQIAGQVDRVEQEGIELDIKDYKTNKKITKEPFMGRTMFHPLRDVPDANYYHYQLQMSLYGWILEQVGYKVRSLELIHVTETGDVSYQVRYMPGWIEKMLHHYDRHRKGV